MPGQTRVTGYFYPRPPRGGRLADFQRRRCVIPFLSTPSARRATSGGVNHGEKDMISIHALREEGDAKANSIEVEILNFYPRPPRGGRL